MFKLSLNRNGRTTYLRVYSQGEANSRKAQAEAQGYSVNVLAIPLSR